MTLATTTNSQYRILVIDDEAAIRRFLHSALSSVEFLGNNIIFISIFMSTLALGLGIFMMIVAVKSRTLPG